jgi:hypothetical protein
MPDAAEIPTPTDCIVCGSNDFESLGRVGHWDGKSQGGDIFGAVCNSCETVWVGKSYESDVSDVHWVIEDDPWWIKEI